MKLTPEQREADTLDAIRLEIRLCEARAEEHPLTQANAALHRVVLMGESFVRIRDLVSAAGGKS